MNEYTLEVELLLNEDDESYTPCEVDVHFTYTRGSRSFFDKIWGNWVPGDGGEISIDEYHIYPENNEKFDLKEIKRLNPKFEDQIRKAIESLDESDILYGDDD